MPNNKFIASEEQRLTVKKMAGVGIPVDQICKCIINPNTSNPISKQTMYDNFRNELDIGMTEANTSVAQSLHQQAVNGNVTAGIWWTKARMGWSEKKHHELEGQINICWDAVDDAMTDYMSGE
ncbi:DNA binding domain [uncultured Mediterranean phage uvMED]|nr:DNA binding domain [uncultured Mediterranean phage uvMED]BAQ89140.1 DNA binding domain [uncultured Mediterranean phage uvMED]